MARGPNWRRITFTPEEIRAEHLTYREQPAPVKVPVVRKPPVKREEAALNPLDTWMP